MGLEAWLARVRAMLRRHVLLNAPWLTGVSDGPSGRALVSFVMGHTDSDSEREPDIAALDRLFAGNEDQTRDLVTIADRFDSLRHDLQMSARDVDALWLLLAPEFDLRFLEVYRLLWGEPTRRYCAEDFVTAVLAPHGPYQSSGLFDDGRAPLIVLGLVEPVVDSQQVLSYRPSRRLIDHIGHGLRPGAQRGTAFTVTPTDEPSLWNDYDFAGSLRAALAPNETPAVGAPRWPTLFVQANRLASVDVAVAQVATAALRGHRPQRPWSFVVTLDLAEHLDTEGALDGREGELEVAHIQGLIREGLRESCLGRGIFHLRGAERLTALGHESLRRLASMLRAAPSLAILESAPPIPPRLLVALGRVPHRDVKVVTLPTPNGSDREFMWQHLESHHPAAIELPTAALAAVPCDAHTMEKAFEAHVLSGRPLIGLLRDLVATSLPRLARRVDVQIDWDSVVLPEETLEQMKQVRALVAHRERIMDTWGFARHANMRGVKLMFSGPSGTGKTLTAGLLARDARCELYQVDVSSVMSKWAGETEKHLATLFRESQASGAALLFDEADALFRQRTSGGEAGERFGAQLVNFLLEAIERYEGVVILTTNFEAVVDTAFARRLIYHVRFKAPGPEQRAALWRLHLPSSLPIVLGVDWESLGASYDLTGGEIQQASMRSAVAAVERGSRQIEICDIESAVHSVYRDKGRLPPRRATA